MKNTCQRGAIELQETSRFYVGCINSSLRTRTNNTKMWWTVSFSEKNLVWLVLFSRYEILSANCSSHSFTQNEVLVDCCWVYFSKVISTSFASHSDPKSRYVFVEIHAHVYWFCGQRSTSLLPFHSYSKNMRLTRIALEAQWTLTTSKKTWQFDGSRYEKTSESEWMNLKINIWMEKRSNFCYFCLLTQSVIRYSPISSAAPPRPQCGLHI